MLNGQQTSEMRSFIHHRGCFTHYPGVSIAVFLTQVLTLIPVAGINSANKIPYLLYKQH